MVTVAVTDTPSMPQRPARALSDRGAPSRRGPDRLTVVLLSVAAFLSVLALLGTQLRAAASSPRAPRVVLVRRIYRTTVVETIAGGGRGPAVSESVSSSGSTGSVSAVPTTRTS